MFNIPSLTSDIVLINFDAPSSPSIDINLSETSSGSNSLGWGLGWYPGNQASSMVVKDPAARSTDWLFMHNGDLDKREMTKVYKGDSRLLEPVGTTDSELAFCNLLTRMEQNGSRSLSEVDPVEILSWFLDNSHDTFRTALVVTSAEFESGNWTPLQAGQMILSNRGKIIWDSLNPDPNWLPIIKTTTTADEPYESRPLHPTRAPQAQTSLAHAQRLAVVQDFVTTPRTITQTMSGRSLAYRMFDVSHSTYYDYAHPVEHSTHLFRLMPTDDLCQEVLHSKLSLTAGAEEIQFEDVFGNQSVHCEIKSPYKSLIVTATSRVRLYETPPDDHGVTMRQTSIPLIWMPWQRQMMTPYLLPPELPMR